MIQILQLTEKEIKVVNKTIFPLFKYFKYEKGFLKRPKSNFQK